jgi:hypothetical protein
MVRNDSAGETGCSVDAAESSKLLFARRSLRARSLRERTLAVSNSGGTSIFKLLSQGAMSSLGSWGKTISSENMPESEDACLLLLALRAVGSIADVMVINVMTSDRGVEVATDPNIVRTSSSILLDVM